MTKKTHSSANIQVVYIAPDDCPRKQEFKDLLATIPDSKMINFYTQDIEELTLIAKHRVLPVPTLLILTNNRVLGRIVSPPPAAQLSDLLADIPALLK